MTGAVSENDNSAILACTISRDVQQFDLLIEDMETVLGESWGDLGFDEAQAFLQQPDAETLEFIAIALDESDEGDSHLIEDLIALAKARGIKVVLITEDLPTNTLHRLIRAGADEFLPYPLPEGELAGAVERLRAAPAPVEEPEKISRVAPSSHNQDGAIFAVQGMAGGTGASMLTVNLAWELALQKTKKPLRICILDLGLQFGNVSTYLDLPRRDAVHELLSNVDMMDDETLCSAMITFNDKIHVLTAPPELLPLDYVSSEDIGKIIDVAAANFDYVLIDVPNTISAWTDAVLTRAHVYFATLELDMRCAHNIKRLKQALEGEDLPLEKLRYILNRTPKFTDLSGRSRIKRMAETLEISLDVHLPDGGKQVTQATDHGLPLAENCGKNPLRKEIAKLAASLHSISEAEDAAA